MVTELPAAAMRQFANLLGGDFYCDIEQARAALLAGSSFNLIHEPTGIKVGLFPSASPLAGAQMERRRRIAIAEPDGPCLHFYTPEDILLQKLLWFRLGGETSERQWRDIIGIVATQGAALDRGYLLPQAEAAGVADLLTRALAE